MQSRFFRRFFIVNYVTFGFIRLMRIQFMRLVFLRSIGQSMTLVLFVEVGGDYLRVVELFVILVILKFFGVDGIFVKRRIFELGLVINKMLSILVFWQEFDLLIRFLVFIVLMSLMGLLIFILFLVQILKLQLCFLISFVSVVLVVLGGILVVFFQFFYCRFSLFRIQLVSGLLLLFFGGC